MSLDKHPLTTSRHELGFYQLDPMPSLDELKDFYEKRYYQEGKGQYSAKYTEEEVAWFHLDARIADWVYRQEFPLNRNPSLFDVGCGEGFFSSHLLENGWKVRACDFSSHGVSHFHPKLLPFFEAGNIYEILEASFEKKQRYDLVNLGNVLEHVTDPFGLLRSLRKVLSPQGLIRIMVPNDFSDLQHFLKAEGKVKRDYWLIPEHLNYFTFNSLSRLIASEGFKMVRLLADHPIEHFLMHDGSNYHNTPSVGKQAHMARVKLDLFYSRNLPAYINMLGAHADLGMGRDVLAYFR